MKSAKAVMDDGDVRPEEAAPTQKAKVIDTLNPIHKLKLRFLDGSFEYQVLEFLEAKETTKSFVLDKVPYEGEELPAEATVQLDNLAEIYTLFPFLKIEIQAHTTAAGNDFGRKTKKVSSKARAMWVATKLNLKGVPNEMLSSSGMADEDLLPEYEPDDKAQKRIMAVLTKSRAF